MQIHHLSLSSKVPTDEFNSQVILIYESFANKQDAEATSFSLIYLGSIVDSGGIAFIDGANAMEDDSFE